VEEGDGDKGKNERFQNQADLQSNQTKVLESAEHITLEKFSLKLTFNYGTRAGGHFERFLPESTPLGIKLSLLFS
jgi:hypothetical protein